MVRARTALIAAASLSVAVFGAACSHDWEKLEPVGGDDAAIGGAAGSAGSGVGGSAGSGGAGGSTDGGAGTGGTPATCSDKTMGLVSGNFGIQFCVDRTEVTNTDYEAFLSASPSVADQPAGCAWNSDYTPSSGWPPAPGTGARPVAFVDWCDAAAFCEGAGKRLCGGIGGGSVPFGSYAKADASEWFNACSNGGKQAYPYGDTYSKGACNGIDYGAGGPVTAASASGCEGGSKGLFDMSGNLFEWENSCSGSSGASDSCRIRGGAFNNNEANLRCDVDATANRNQATVTIGFRCCDDAIVN